MADKNPLRTLPEAFVSTSALSALVGRGVRDGTLRKIGPRLYTRNLVDAPDRVVRRNLWPIVAGYAPGALIADRTAIENAPAADGSVFLVADRVRNVVLPGITIRVRNGAPPRPEDRPFVADLRLSSVPRAWLDNAVPSRARTSGVSRTLSRAELETRLADFLRRNGVEALNRLRDEARALSGPLDREQAFAVLDRLIGALLGTREAALVTPQGRARRAGRAFDPDRLRLFDALHAELRARAPVARPAPPRTAEGEATLAFFEAYFSNFIEGTEFEVAEAAAIVFDGRIPAARPEDAHDVLGTWRLVSDRAEMRRTPADADDLLALLRARHAAIMGARPDKQPGVFKSAPNRAGSTLFVAPDLVEGTLRAGFDYWRNLHDAFARAAFMGFLVAEVHPFADGNGRLSRVMMNADLVAAGEERIVAPTVFRNNYLAALRALSHGGRPEALVQALDYLQRWTLAIPWGSLDEAQRLLSLADAFLDANDAERRGLRLQMPRGLD